METLKVIYHTYGNDKCLENVVNYPIGKDQVLKEGFGIDPNDSYQAFQQFKRDAEFWGNQDKTPCFHYVTSFTDETAPTAEKAMELTKEIFKDISGTHLTAMGTHCKEHDGGKYHSHTVASPTNINDGSMLYVVAIHRNGDMGHLPLFVWCRSFSADVENCPRKIDFWRFIDNEIDALCKKSHFFNNIFTNS